MWCFRSSPDGRCDATAGHLELLVHCVEGAGGGGEGDEGATGADSEAVQEYEEESDCRLPPPHPHHTTQHSK